MTTSHKSKTLSRRRFLRTLGNIGGAAVGMALPTLQGSALARPPMTRGDRGLAALARDMSGRLIIPGEIGFSPAAWPNNSRWSDVKPVAIAMCADDADVQRAITWARDNRTEFAIRSGGHSYAGFSTTPGLLIHLKSMNAVKADYNNGIAIVQGGACNQDVASALRARNFAVPSGRCPTVGVGGLVLGGGWGFSATKSGLTCDSLIETSVIDAGGKAVIANDRNNHSDLFWAARGAGGGNFGAHTSFTFQLREVGDVTMFDIAWEAGKQIDLMVALQRVQIENPTLISMRSKAVPAAAGPNPDRRQMYVVTLGQFFGKEKQFREIMAPVLTMQPTRRADIREMTFWQARDYLVTEDPIGLYRLRSSYVENMLGSDALDVMFDWMSKWPGGSVRQENMGLLFAIGGAVRSKKPQETAYVHRNANFLLEMSATWSPLDKLPLIVRQREWLAAYFADMQRFLLPQSYVNFPDRELKNYAQAYYGSNLARLTAIKRKYDPDNVFKFAQSIPLTTGAGG